MKAIRRPKIKILKVFYVMKTVKEYKKGNNEVLSRPIMKWIYLI